MLKIDSILGLISPNLCIACGKEGSIMCDNCLQTAGEPIPSRCVGCMAMTEQYRTCNTCRGWLDVYAVYVAVSYEGIYGQLVKKFKFDVNRQAASAMAGLMLESIEDLEIPENALYCPIPTAPSRIRQRGFDHAKLLSNKLISNIANSKEAPWKGKVSYLLGRNTNVRQLGASRAKRIEQMKNEFYVKKPEDVNGRTVYIIDDVLTTGASLSAAAKTLKEAGAKRVYGIIFAQKI